jgi:predicted transcriptional regulator
MNLDQVLTAIDGEVVSCQAGWQQDVSAGAAADLMSDVLAYSRPDSLLLTGLVYPQVVRTAEMAGIRAIVFVRGKHPPAETINLADEVGIPLLSTRYTLYEACGRLYAAGLPGLGLCESYDLAGWPVT